MLTTSFALLAAIASLALADITVTVTKTLTLSSTGIYGGNVYTTTSESTYTTSSPISTSAPTNISVQVGPGGQLVYSPSNISANVGDTVQFFFNPKNHTVTQSSFNAPCEKLEVSTGKVGLDSEFTNPTNVSLTTVGFQFTVNDTKPLWFYCEQKGHCVKGMVFAVNANENKTFAAFQANAMNSNSSSTTPSASVTSGGSTGTATNSGVGATATGATASSTSSPNSNDAISTSINVGLTGLIAIVGGFILAL